MRGLDEIATNVRLTFERVHRERFQGDPAANPRLTVDVIGPAVVDGIPTAVLLTPWTINGLAFPPDGEFPDSLEIAGRRRRVFRIELAELGAFYSVNLPLEPANLRSMAQARGLASSWVPHFRDAVRMARRASEAAPGRLDPAGAGEDPNDPRQLPREALTGKE